MFLPWILIGTFVGVLASHKLHKIQKGLRGTSTHSKTTASNVLNEGSSTCSTSTSGNVQGSVDVNTIGADHSMKNVIMDIESSTKHELSSSITIDKVTSPDSISIDQSKHKD